MFITVRGVNTYSVQTGVRWTDWLRHWPFPSILPLAVSRRLWTRHEGFLLKVNHSLLKPNLQQPTSPEFSRQGTRLPCRRSGLTPFWEAFSSVAKTTAKGSYCDRCVTGTHRLRRVRIDSRTAVQHREEPTNGMEQQKAPRA